MRRLLIIGLVLLVLCGIASASYFIGGVDFSYNVTHYINGSSSGALTNYPVTLVMYNTTGVPTGENFYIGGQFTQTDWDDVVFSQDGTTALPMWLETASINSTSARFWVNMSSITGGVTNQTKLYIYFGNASKTSLSNGNTTFPFFDDFNEASLNTTKWNDGQNPSISNGALLMTRSDNSWAYASTDYRAFGVNNTTTMRAKFGHVGSNAVHEWVGWYQTASPYYDASLWVSLQTVPAFSPQQENNDGTQHKSGVAITGISAGDYANIELIRHPSNLGVIINRGSEYTFGTGYTTVQMAPIISVYGNTATVYVDWVFVKPYFYTEPSHSGYVLIPNASFSANRTSGSSPLDVAFTDTSAGTPTSWLWQFGDGNTSTVQNATHTFFTGNWLVNFSATNAAGTSWRYDTWINSTTGGSVIAPVASFTTNWTGSLPISKSVAFTDTSTNTPTAWQWNFGDGAANSTTQNPVYKWTKRGAWTVVMTSSNSAGSSSSYTTVRVVGG